MPDRSAQELVQQIATLTDRIGKVSIMEVCGTHTVSLFRSGVKSLMPQSLRLISGPGCPVCVTWQGYIDAACELATQPNVTICTYGDMVRVPGQSGSLETKRAAGAQVRVVYSVRDAVLFAENNPGRQVVFLAVGFETTAPATAAAIVEAKGKGLDNFTVLLGHKLVMPAMMALLAMDDTAVDGFLCPGHVSIIIGSEAYRPIVDKHNKPCVVAGFEPKQMLLGILRIVEQLAAGKPDVDNVYPVAVTPQGNVAAMKLIDNVFEPIDTLWRAMGTIPQSGMGLRPNYATFDAATRFKLDMDHDYDPPGCQCGQVIQGTVEPADCPLFGEECTPMSPVGPCMVSSEGTCAAWYKYARHTL